MTIATLHDRDYHAWTQQQIDLLKARRLTDLDLESLVEELDDMGGSARRELVNRLGILLAHLLKWRYQATRRLSSWSGTIKEQRRKLDRLLRENPSLKPLAPDRLQDAYGDALALVEKETGLDERHFPADCPFTLEQTLDREYWP